MKKEGKWNFIEKDGLPETIGCYLCKTSDNWLMMCFVNALGDWMLRPGGAYYGDIWGAEKFGNESRTITHWMKLPDYEGKYGN